MFEHEAHPLLSIIVVNYNGKNFLSDCFNSIELNCSLPYELILVDNASWDGSQDYVRNNHPEVKLVVSQVNTGFTGGNNIGAKFATGKYLLLLNNDTVVRSSINPMIEIMESDANIGVLGCQLVYGNDRLQESIGLTLSVLSLVLSWTPLTRIFYEINKFRRTVYYNSPIYKKKFVEVDWVSGACLMTRADLWRSLGGLDEKYFMYMEEVDYCMRVKNIGRSVSYTASCKVTHFEGSGRPWIGARALLNTTDSYMVYFSKFHGSVSLFVLRVFLAPIFLMRSIGYMVLYIMHLDLFGAEKSRAYFFASLKLIQARVRN